MTAEIELRAHLSEDAFEVLETEMKEHGPPVQQARCFIDYSTFIEGIGDRKLDVRVRVTNGIPEIVIKKGQFGGAVREEAAAKVEKEDLEEALSAMALLGYQKGVAGGRRIRRGIVGDIEVALQEVLDFNHPEKVADRFLEVEYKGNAANDEAEATLREFLQARGLEAFTVSEWNEYVRMLNEHWNGVYEHGVTSPEVIRTLGS